MNTEQSIFTWPGSSLFPLHAAATLMSRELKAEAQELFTIIQGHALFNLRFPVG